MSGEVVQLDRVSKIRRGRRLQGTESASFEGFGTRKRREAFMMLDLCAVYVMESLDGKRMKIGVSIDPWREEIYRQKGAARMAGVFWTVGSLTSHRVKAAAEALLARAPVEDGFFVMPKPFALNAVRLAAQKEKIPLRTHEEVLSTL